MQKHSTQPSTGKPHDSNIMRIKVYQAGIDRVHMYQQKLSRINEKYEEKLENARVNGKPDSHIYELQQKWQKELNSPSMEKLRELAETCARPTKEQMLKSQEAANDFIAENEGLVAQMIYNMYHSYVGTSSMDDLMNAGRMGLFQSMAGYDPSKGAFSTYAVKFIKNAVSRVTGAMQNLSPHYQAEVKKYKEAVAKLQNDGIINPTLSEVAGEMGTGLLAAHRAYLKLTQVNPISIDDEGTGLSRMSDVTALDPEEMAIKKETAEATAKALAKLSDDQRLIINLKHLEDDKPSKNPDIGMQLAKQRNPDAPESSLKPVKANEINILHTSALNTLKTELAGYHGAEDHIPSKGSLKTNVYPDFEPIMEEVDIIHGQDDSEVENSDNNDCEYFN